MKTKMILVLMVLLMAQTARSQGMPVYDNTSFLALGKSLIESAKQTSQLLKTVNFLKEQKERIEQVSNALKQLKAVQEIIDNNQRLFTTVQNDLREILNSPFIKAEEIDRISESFNSIIESSLEDLNFMQQLLTNNYLTMTDAERLVILEAQKERSREMVAEIQLKNKRYRTIISFREMQSRINNRETDY
ncbi:conjugal transfer protein [Salinimicrobium sp. CAU 1759]|jgi:tetrahydrodipicolinate N-succinyltransferase